MKKVIVFCLFFALFSSLHSDEIAENSAIVSSDNSGYTINYDTIAITEYLRFASKICGVNFLFNKEELDFTVTVLSDAPVTPQNVMATLLQTLRVYGFEILEQEGSLLIHKGTGVHQIATLVTENNLHENAPIVTRVFRVRHLKPDSIAAIIRPMISSASILEVLAETHQIILTDITSNVDKVASLIEILDSPYNPLEVKSYHPEYHSLHALMQLCNQILQPIAQGNPFSMVSQTLTNSIFIVSTPDLVARAMTILKSLDQPHHPGMNHEKMLGGENLFVYRGENLSPEDLLAALKEIQRDLKASGIVEGDLLDTIDSAKVIRESGSLFFVGSKESLIKLKELLTALDVPCKGSKEGKAAFFLYRPQNKSASEIEEAIQEMQKNLAESNGVCPLLLEALSSVKINQATNTLVFSGSDSQFGAVKELLSTIDTPSGKKSSSKKGFFLYKIERASFDELQEALKNFAKNLNQSNIEDEGLIDAISHMKSIPETQSILFSGNESSLKRLKELVPLFDAGIAPFPPSNQLFIYKPHYQRGDLLAHSIKELIHDLKSDRFADLGLLRTLESMKYVKSTNALLFTGDQDSLRKLENLLATLDLPSDKAAEKVFYFYTPPENGKEKVETYLSQLSNSLDKKNDVSLIELIRSARWIDASRSFFFQGTEPSIQRLKELLENFQRNSLADTQNFFLYPLQHASKTKVNQYLDQLTENLEKQGTSNLDLIEVIRKREWISDSNSFLFSGNEQHLNQVKEILQGFDTIESAAPKTGYSIYKLQNTTTDIIEEDLDHLAKDFEHAGISDKRVLTAIEQIRYVKETNSLLLTGDPSVIEELKTIIQGYDHPPVNPEGSVNKDFFMYKPLHLAASEIEKSLRDVGTSLKEANLADPSLLKTIESAKYVPTTNSIIFTGSTESLQRVQSLLKEIDLPPKNHAPIQHVGKTTFLLYKLKHADGTQIVTSLRAMETDLKRSNQSDRDFVSALSSMKYVKETNSLLFTGTEAALSKVEELVSSFDVQSLSAPQRPVVEKTPTPTSTNFFLYRPNVIPGPDLERLMQDFADNLKLSGLSDPDLFNAIMSMRWVEKTQSLIFTGTPKALEQVKTLLKEFDIPANLVDRQPADGSLQMIDNTNFLVYKLQFHRGDEIQGALRQIAKDLANNNAPVNHGLLNAIQSIQWLDVTNSLLCSGDQETLTRLKELIKNLDIPLKQVFIEILVIETSLTNALNFGLEWGGNYKFNDKFGASTYNTMPPANVQSVFPDTFISNLGKLNPPAPPTPIGNIPANAGFDLGVIGEVIKHNGQTFLTLGSLLSALQSDTETTIVNTPKILAQDGRTSVFFSGSNIPFTGSFVNNTQSGATIQTSNLEYRDIGLKLTITPVLGNSDIVTLDINLDREQTATDLTQSQLNFSSQTANGIVTSKTMMQTTVHVPDKNFLILSGFVNNSNTKQKAGIPCLGGLPMIGAAFSQSNDTISAQNIVIFLRPYILNSIDDMRRITAQQEEFFREQSATPFLEHNYDESIELLKTIDDE